SCVMVRSLLEIFGLRCKDKTKNRYSQPIGFFMSKRAKTASRILVNCLPGLNSVIGVIFYHDVQINFFLFQFFLPLQLVYD
ncbi:MAG: hypothetical protein IKZ87_01775, partial [Actinomycetaceae bacterium]|nr:hypothetical protein [Actinomycetaceae bacterium]